MVHGYEDHIALLGQVLAIVAILLYAIACSEATTMEPNHHRTLGVIGVWCPDVQEEAVLTEVAIVPVITPYTTIVGKVRIILRSAVAIVHRILDVCPRFWSLGWHETVLAAGISTIADTQIRIDSALDEATHLAILGLSHCDVVTDVDLLFVSLVHCCSVALCTTTSRHQHQGGTYAQHGCTFQDKRFLTHTCIRING